MMAAEQPLYPYPVSTLSGKRVVITRAAEQANTLADMLQARSAEALLYPCIAIEPPADTGALDSALQSAARGEFDWLILTSSNAVNILAQRAAALQLDVSGMRAAAVGRATAEAAQSNLVMRVEFLPEIYSSAALAATIPVKPGERVLLPQADIALTDLSDALERRGAAVLTVMAYRTVMGVGGAAVPLLLKQRTIDAITFTSPSAVRNFLWRLVEESGCTADLRHAAIACIGAATAAAAERCGLSVEVLPQVSTLEHLVQSLEDYFS